MADEKNIPACAVCGETEDLATILSFDGKVKYCICLAHRTKKRFIVCGVCGAPRPSEGQETMHREYCDSNAYVLPMVRGVVAANDLAYIGQGIARVYMTFSPDASKLLDMTVKDIINVFHSYPETESDEPADEELSIFFTKRRIVRRLFKTLEKLHPELASIIADDILDFTEDEPRLAKSLMESLTK